MKSNHPQDIKILGAGVMGLTCGYVLANALPETNITIIDPAGFPANNASRMAGGMLAPYCECDHLPAQYIPAGLDSINFWRTLSKKTQDPFEFAQRGSLILAHAEDRHMLERLKSVLPPENQGIQVDVTQTEPALAGRFKDALLIEGEAHLHPGKVLDTLAQALQNLSVTFAKKETSSNQPSFTVDCRGLDAQDDTPTLRGVKGEILIVRNPDFSLTRPLRLMHPRYPLYIVPREGNIFMIGATIIESADDQISLRSGLELMSALYSLHPTFAHAQILEIKAGIRPAFPDNLPRITRTEKTIRCNGLFRHGYLLAPAMAQCVKDMIEEKYNGLMPLFTKEKTDEDYPQRHRNTA